jgi:hypothetical protein
MKKLLALSLLLVLSAPAFGAGPFKQALTKVRIFAARAKAFPPALVYAYRNKDFLRLQALKMHVEGDWVRRRIITLEKETGMTAQQAGEKYQPKQSLLGGDAIIDPLVTLNLRKKFHEFSKLEQLAVLNSKRDSLPTITIAKKMLDKCSPLVKSGLLEQIPGTDEHRMAQVLSPSPSHIQQLIEKADPDIKKILYPNPVKKIILHFNTIKKHSKMGAFLLY